MCLSHLQYIQNLGVGGGWQFLDVYGLEDELLSMVPRPLAAVMLLYPLTDKVIREKGKMYVIIKYAIPTCRQGNMGNLVCYN